MRVTSRKDSTLCHRCGIPSWNGVPKPRLEGLPFCQGCLNVRIYEQYKRINIGKKNEKVLLAVSRCGLCEGAVYTDSDYLCLICRRYLDENE